MTVDEFLTEFQDLLQCDEPVHIDGILKNMDEWDSMSMMACMAWFDAKFGIKLPYKTFARQTTVRGIIELMEGRIA